MYVLCSTLDLGNTLTRLGGTAGILEGRGDVVGDSGTTMALAGEKWKTWAILGTEGISEEAEALEDF